MTRPVHFVPHVPPQMCCGVCRNHRMVPDPLGSLRDPDMLIRCDKFDFFPNSSYDRCAEFSKEGKS